MGAHSEAEPRTPLRAPRGSGRPERQLGAGRWSSSHASTSRGVVRRAVFPGPADRPWHFPGPLGGGWLSSVMSSGSLSPTGTLLSMSGITPRESRTYTEPHKSGHLSHVQMSIHVVTWPSPPSVSRTFPRPHTDLCHHESLTPCAPSPVPGAQHPPFCLYGSDCFGRPCKWVTRDLSCAWLSALSVMSSRFVSVTVGVRFPPFHG